MNDRELGFTVTQVVASVAGVLAWAAVLGNFWLPNDNLGFVGIMLGGLSAVLRVRSFVCKGVESVNRREEAAFQLGRDSVRSLR